MAAGIYTRPRIVLTVDVEAGARFVTVAGEVRTPGDVKFRHDLTMLTAISARGGFTDFASEKRVRLIRGSKVTTHDVRRFVREPKKDIKLRPGDRLVVPPAGLWRR